MNCEEMDAIGEEMEQRAVEEDMQEELMSTDATCLGCKATDDEATVSGTRGGGARILENARCCK